MQKTITILGRVPLLLITTGSCDSLTVNFRSLNTTNWIALCGLFWWFCYHKRLCHFATYSKPGFMSHAWFLQDINGCKVPLQGADTIKVIGTTRPLFHHQDCFATGVMYSLRFNSNKRANYSCCGTLAAWRYITEQKSGSFLYNTGKLYSQPQIGTEFGCFDS